MSLNGISHQLLKRDRQDDKLLIAEAKRQGKTVADDGTISGSVDPTKNYYRTLNELDYSQLPTRYNPTSNTGDLVENPNPNGLLLGRPFSTSGVTLSGLVVQYDATYAVSGNNITDQTNNGNTGVLVGATHDAANDYFTFDGVNDYLRTSNIYSGIGNPDSFSAGLWVYPTLGGNVMSVSSSNTAPLSNYHYSSIAILNSFGQPHPYFGVWNGTGITSVTGGSAGSYNNWYHLAITYNAATNTLAGYVNGSAVGSQSVVYDSPHDAGHTTQYCVFGISEITNMGNGNYFPGRMNEINIYSDALTATEVLANYNASKSRYGY